MKRNPNSAGETEQEPEKRKRQKKSENQDDTSLFNWFVVGFAEGSKNVSVKSEENNTDLWKFLDYKWIRSLFWHKFEF